MIELGFINCLSDVGVFIFRNKRGYVIVVIYVDDAIFMGPNKMLLLEKKREFMAKWEC